MGKDIDGKKVGVAPTAHVASEAGVQFAYLGDVSLSRAIRYGILRGIKQGYDAVGFLDDDARIKDPPHAMRQFLKGSRQKWGAFGPLHQMRVWQKYKNDPGSGFHEISLGRATSGCQVYGMPFLLMGRKLIFNLLNVVEWWSDYSLFMIAHSLGFKIGEVYTPFLHVPCGQKLRRHQIKFEDAEKVWRKRRQLMIEDAKRIVTFFEEYNPAYVPYARLLYDSAKRSVNPFDLRSRGAL
jgi:hypothetical protein